MHGNRSRVILSFLVAGLLPVSAADAHPVPRRTHDRVITVRLAPEAVTVDYHLELDEWTVVFADLPAVNDQVDLTKLQQPKDFYDAFTRVYAPILADNLVASLDGKPLEFRCVRRGYEVKDSLMCEFVFQAPCQVARGKSVSFTFQETNYELEAGQIQLSLAVDPALTVLQKEEPDEVLKKRPATDLQPGDEVRLRKLSATVQLADTAGGPTAAAPSAPPPPGNGPEESPPSAAGTPRSGSLLRLLLDSQQGFWVLLLIAAGFGAVHALTPGHGKTLVAAYLVGERGTVWHALLLGVTTTLTHTGVVLILAFALRFCPVSMLDPVQAVLGLVGGLAITGLGFWLLLRRLSGRADHVHIGGHGHHHHHHGHGHHHHDHGLADHDHDEHGHVLPLPAAGDRVGWWSILVLGISGGLVPCMDAILMLFFAIAARRLWLALPLLLAFSAGLAGVLVLLGVLVVSAKRLAQDRLGDGRLRRVFQALPVVSAAVIIVMGLWLCQESLAPPAPPAAQAQSHP